MLILLAVALAPLFAQGTRAPQSAMDDAREQFDLVATRAAAYQRSAETIEARLNREGMTMHPQIIALRTRIGVTLDKARHALDMGDAKAANRAIKAADALVDRLAQKLGG